VSAWDAIWETGKTISAIVVAAGGPGLLLYFVQDRRKNRAASTVAERTVEPEVGLKETGAAEARLVYIQREMDAERQFHRNQIDDRDAEILRQRAELDHRDTLIAELRAEAVELRDQLAHAGSQIASLLERIEQLGRHDYGSGSRPVPHQRGERP